MEIIIVAIIILIILGPSIIKGRKSPNDTAYKSKVEPALTLEEERRKKEEKRKQEEKREKRIEEIKSEIHKLAKEHVYVEGDKRRAPAALLSYIHPRYIDTEKERILNEMASGGNGIDHEAQWVCSTRYIMGFDDDPDGYETAGHRIFNAARAGVVPALIYCLDDYKSRGVVDDAVGCLQRIEEKDKETAYVIKLEWKNEGFYFERDQSALMELLDYAKLGRAGNAASRARWYLDLKGIDWEN